MTLTRFFSPMQKYFLNRGMQKTRVVVILLHINIISDTLIEFFGCRFCHTGVANYCFQGKQLTILISVCVGNPKVSFHLFNVNESLNQFPKAFRMAFMSRDLTLNICISLLLIVLPCFCFNITFFFFFILINVKVSGTDHWATVTVGYPV